MGRQMVTVRHELEENGTAVVPESALKFMPGWSVVEDDTAAESEEKPEGASGDTTTPKASAAGNKSAAPKTPKEKP